MRKIKYSHITSMVHHCVNDAVRFIRRDVNRCAQIVMGLRYADIWADYFLENEKRDYCSKEIVVIGFVDNDDNLFEIIYSISQSALNNLSDNGWIVMPY